MNAPYRRSIAFDVAVGVAFAAIAFLEAATHADGGPRGTAPAVLEGAAAALAPLPLLVRRARPLTSTALAVALATVPHLLIDYDVILIGGLFVIAVALEGAARYGRRPRNRVALLLPLVPLGLFAVTVPGFADQTLVYVVVLGVGWTVGVLFRALSEQRAALDGLLDARMTAQNLEAERAILAERAAVARELHDVIAHCVSVMVLQAGAARLLLEANPAGSAESIDQIETTGREALIELQRVLGVLRAPAETEVLASLTRLDHLTEQIRAAGLEVSVELKGNLSALPSGLDHSLYRILQESLTNALKHGTGTRADVHLVIADDCIELDVRNVADGPARAALPGGNGQTGMQERVAAYGGQLSTLLESGQYRVRAVLPIEAVER